MQCLPRQGYDGGAVQGQLISLSDSKGRGKYTPKSEILLFPYGTTVTEYGPLEMTEEDAAEVMAVYEASTKRRDGRLDIDYAHNSRTDNADPRAHYSAGSFRLALRSDGIYAVDIEYTEDALAEIESGKFRSFSPVVTHDKDGHIKAIRQFALTNIPASWEAGLLAASVNGFMTAPLVDGPWDRDAADQRVRELLSSDGSGDLDKVDLDRYRGCFAFYDGDAPENVSAFKGLVCDVSDGRLMIHRGAVEALAGVMQGARGGIAISDEDMAAGRDLIAKYYALWDATPPWDREEQEDSMAEMNSDGVEIVNGEGQVGTLSEGAQVSIEGLQVNVHPKFSLLADGFMKRASKLGEMVRGKMGLGEDGYVYTEEIYDDYADVCVYGLTSADGERSKVYRVPYTMGEDDKLILGEMVELEVVRRPKGSGAEGAMLSQRQGEAHSRLLSLTGVETTSEALIAVEAALRDAKRAPALEKRLGDLEEREFSRERQVLLSSAKAAGKWTADMEAEADEKAAFAKRLNEDRVAALSAFWKRAPVVVSMASHTPPGGTPKSGEGHRADSDDELTEEEVAALKEQSRHFKALSFDQLKAQYLSQRRPLRG